MEQKEKSKKVTKIVFNCIWLVISLILWICGLIAFLEKKDQDALGAWLSWGGICVIPVLIPILKWSLHSGKTGARDGANTYTATDNGDSIHIQNHPIRGAIVGFLVGLALGILAGPAVLGFYIVKITIETVKTIIYVKKSV